MFSIGYCKKSKGCWNLSEKCRGRKDDKMRSTANLLLTKISAQNLLGSQAQVVYWDKRVCIEPKLIELSF
jgi:hypothetical protein